MNSLLSEQLTQTAKVAHEVNRVWCEYNGDNTQPSWDDAPEWQTNSAMSGARFHMNNPEAGDDALHNNWMQDKINDGWTYEPIKDPENKLHPCLVPFSELPREQQFKDQLFRTVCRSMLD